MKRTWLAALLLALAPVVPVAGTAEAAVTTWYVRAGATGNGTAAAPLGSLTQVERRSHAGDTIVVLPAVEPLDGGLRLKPGQTVRGVAGTGGRAPRVTNTTSRLDGDAVRLAVGTTVRGLRIVDPLRGAIYGHDVTRVRVVGNDISGQNGSCTKGFLIPPFNAPTNVPGVGIPISGGLQNGWAAIGVDASTGNGLTASIVGNVVHDATCGDGIDVRFSGTASGSVAITGNRVTQHALIDLGGGPLGSAGRNCLDGGALSADVVRYDVSARASWWGQASGPAPLQTLVVGGTLGAAAPLSNRPEWCPAP